MSLGSQLKLAYYLILLGSICTCTDPVQVSQFLLSGYLWNLLYCWLSGFMRHTVVLFLAAYSPILHSVFLLSGAAVWTAVIKRVLTISIDTPLHSTIVVPLRLQVSVGWFVYDLGSLRMPICINYSVSCVGPLFLSDVDTSHNTYRSRIWYMIFWWSPELRVLLNSTSVYSVDCTTKVWLYGNASFGNPLDFGGLQKEQNCKGNPMTLR